MNPVCSLTGPFYPNLSILHSDEIWAFDFGYPCLAHVLDAHHLFFHSGCLCPPLLVLCMANGFWFLVACRNVCLYHHIVNLQMMEHFDQDLGILVVNGAGNRVYCPHIERERFVDLCVICLWNRPRELSWSLGQPNMVNDFSRAMSHLWIFVDILAISKLKC